MYVFVHIFSLPWYTKVPDKMAYVNSADLDQALYQVEHCVPSTMYFKKLHKKQNLGQNIE